MNLKTKNILKKRRIKILIRIKILRKVKLTLIGHIIVTYYSIKMINKHTLHPTTILLELALRINLQIQMKSLNN